MQKLLNVILAAAMFLGPMPLCGQDTTRRDGYVNFSFDKVEVGSFVKLDVT